MKKIFALAFVAGMVAFASCTSKPAEESTTDSTAMESTMDTTTMMVDSMASDSTVGDSL